MYRNHSVEISKPLKQNIGHRVPERLQVYLVQYDENICGENCLACFIICN